MVGLENQMDNEHFFNLLEVQEDPANQWILDVPSALSLHDHPGHPYLP